MKEPKRRQSLSGMVLIMILTIMTVLIVLLTATLSVVSSANQRIYTKYEENQAYYTARSALDVFTVKMLSDKAYYVQAAMGEAKDASGNKIYIHGDKTKTQNDAMTQGLGLQLDMYAINTVKDDAGKDLGANVSQADLTAYANTISDSEKKQDEYLTYFGVTDPAVTKLEYEVTLPKISQGTGGTGNDYGKFSDTDTSGYGTAHITIEILDRTYALGSYTSGGVQKAVLEGDEKAFVMKSATSPSGTDYSGTHEPNSNQIAEAIFNGNRKKDSMRVKITATTYFEGVEGTAVLIYDTDEPSSVNNSRAITSFGGVGGSNHLYIVGGASMSGDRKDDDADGIPDNTNSMMNEGGFYGTIYDEIGLHINVSGTPIYLTEAEYLYVSGNLEVENSSNIKGMVSDTDISQRPFVYVAGKLITGSGNNVGIGGAGKIATEKVDVICAGGIDFNNTASWTINGNVISGGDATIISTAGHPNIEGNLYIDGDLYLAKDNCVSVTTDATGVVTDIKLIFDDSNAGVTDSRKCNVYVSGNVFFNADGSGYTLFDKSHVFNSDGSAIGTFTAHSISNQMATDDDIFDTSTGKLQHVVDLSGKLPGITGTIERRIDTRKANYDQYYLKDASGDYVDNDSDGVPDAKPATELAGEDFTNSAFIAAASGELTLTSQTIDTGGLTKRLVLHGSQSASGVKIEVKGGGTLELCLDLGGNAWYTPSSFSINGNGNSYIVVDDDTTLKVYGCVQGVDYAFEKFRIVTKSVYDAIENGSRLDAGSKVGHNIKVPKIYYYFDGRNPPPSSTNQTISTSNKESILAGYLYAPDSTLSTSGGSVTFNNLYYNGQKVDSSWPITFYGSVLCKDFAFANDEGIVYVNPDLDSDGNAGEPIHAWKSYRYARN